MKKTVYKEIEEAKAKREDLIKELKVKMVEAVKDQNAKKKTAADVLSNGSPENYVKARAAEKEADHIAEFYKAKLADIERKPLFEGVELNSKVEAIREDVKKKKAEKMKVAIEAIQSGYNTLCELSEELTKANAAIKDLEENCENKLPRIDQISVASISRTVFTLSNMTESKPYWK